MLARWLDRDDLTDEDLREITAEEEVMDWMIGSPLPTGARREWLPEGHELSDPGPRRRRPLAGPPQTPSPPVALLVAGVAAIGALGVIGLAGVASLVLGLVLWS